MFEISFLAPLVATIVALINFLLVVYNFRSKPWNFKIWLIMGMFFWVPWAGFTVLMRIAPTVDTALFYLQLSFICSYVTFYSLFRFHNMLTLKGDSKFLTFFMAVFMGVNLGLGMNPDFLTIQTTADGKYFTDLFATQLIIPHVLFTIILGYLVYRTLREIDAISIFYTDNKKEGSKAQLLFGVVIIVIDIGALLFFFLNEGTQDATPFLILSIIVTTWLGITYGVRPLSSILSPQRLWTFFIVSRSGLPIYEYHFSDKETIGELALIGGAINASNITLMNYLDSEFPLREIELEDRVVIIENFEQTLFCLVADKNTQVLQLVQKDVVKQIINDPAFTKDEDGFAKITDINAIESYVQNAYSSSDQGGITE